jgi:hypothetical protein
MKTLRTWLRIDDPRAHLVFMTVVFIGLGATMILQPTRYANTPSYANLLALVPAWGWGLAYLFCAALHIFSLFEWRRDVIVYMSHTVSIVLTAFWWVAFLVRWVTDDGTTIVNVLTWGTFLYLLLRSSMKIKDHASVEGGASP